MVWMVEVFFTGHVWTSAHIETDMRVVRFISICSYREFWLPFRTPAENRHIEMRFQQS